MNVSEMKFKRMSDWLPVDYEEITEDMKEYTGEEDYWQPCFKWKDETHWLSDFIRCHHNLWSGMDGVPDYIHGYQGNTYWNPLFIEVDDSGEGVRLYELQRGEN